MNLIFIFSFLICFLSYAIHTWATYLETNKKTSNNKTVEKIISTIIHLGYVAWVFMIFSDPVRGNFSNYVAMPVGLLIGITGTVLFALSVIDKKGYHDLNYLVKTGIYSKIRHPMYLGIILIHIGFPIAWQSILTLASAIIWIPQILLWKYWEDKYLEKKFGNEYIGYKKKTIF